MTAAERYKWACETESDISLHVVPLYNYAMQCSHITEFGVRGAVSTSAWLYSAPETLRCYDIAAPGCLLELEAIAREVGTDFRFTQADTSTVEIEPTDLLFIDTLHTGEHVAAELRNAELVRKYIIFHDTDTNGWVGEGGGSGIKRALIEFLLHNTEWRIVYHTDMLNGLTALKRVESLRAFKP